MKVILIKPDHFGDFALTLPSIFEAVQRWEKSSFIILASPQQKEWERILPWMPRIHSWQHPRYARSPSSSTSEPLFQALSEGLWLRNEKWDFSIELTSSRHDFLGKAISWIAGAKSRLGQEGHWDFLLTEKQNQGTGSQKERMAERFPREWKITGKTDPQQFIPSTLRWRPTPEAVPLFFPWAGTSAKLWPTESWKSLHQQFPESQFLTPRALQSVAREWQAKYDLPPSSFLYTDSLLQTLQILTKAKSLVALDTGIAHFSWLTGTPLIQLFAATTDPQRWKSPGASTLLHSPPPCAPCKSEICTQASHLCMNAITVESVIQSLNQKKAALTE